MASIQDFRAAILAEANKAVLGAVTASRLDRTVGDFDAERFMYRSRPEPTTPTSFTVPNENQIWGMQAGNKIVQVRMWATTEDHVSDSNAIALVAGVEIHVHRHLLDSSESGLYVDDEMLENQRLLLQHSRWNTLAEFDAFVPGEEPLIDSAPTQTGLIISYQMEMQCRVKPD